MRRVSFLRLGRTGAETGSSSLFGGPCFARFGPIHQYFGVQHPHSNFQSRKEAKKLYLAGKETHLVVDHTILFRVFVFLLTRSVNCIAIYSLIFKVLNLGITTSRCYPMSDSPWTSSVWIYT
ncbi:hypothetical protein ABKN59_001809 [Abortiporus biennis]